MNAREKKVSEVEQARMLSETFRRRLVLDELYCFSALGLKSNTGEWLRGNNREKGRYTIGEGRGKMGKRGQGEG